MTGTSGEALVDASTPKRGFGLAAVVAQTVPHDWPHPDPVLLPPVGEARARVAVLGGNRGGVETAVSLGLRGYPVMLAESDSERRGAIREGRAADASVAQGLAAVLSQGLLQVTERVEDVTKWAPYLFICSGSGDRVRGSAAMAEMEKVSAELRRAPAPAGPAVVVLGHSVVGTADWLQHHLLRRYHVAVVPDLPGAELSGPILVGADGEEAAAMLASLFGFQLSQIKIVSRRDAEMIISARSAVAAVKHSMASELAGIAKRLGTDIEEVLQGADLERRGASSHGPGRLQGEMDILLELADSAEVTAPVLHAARQHQIVRDSTFMKVLELLPEPAKRRVGVWGLSYSQNGRERRTSAALSIAESLAAMGAIVVGYDPLLSAEANLLQGAVRIVPDRNAAAADADLLLVLTELTEADEVDWSEIRELMAGHDVLDACGILDPEVLASGGLDHHSATTPSPRRPGVLKTPLLASGRAALAAKDEARVAEAGPRRPPASSSPVYPVVKRAVDLVGAVVGILLASPIFVCIAVILWLESGRPILFHARRTGLNGRLFTMYKFRSMRTDAPPSGNKSSLDRYVSRVGRVLRRTSLDELPQLWNLLQGDITLVGPRPEQPYIVEWYQPWQAKRMSVKPGLTGWWQVCMRGKNPEMYQHIEYDLWYVQHRSLLLDLEILLRTPLALLSAGG